MQSLLRIGQRVLVRSFGNGYAVDADSQARGVHHHEHGGQAMVRFTHQPAARLVELHTAGRATVYAHFVFDARALNGIAFAQSFVLRKELGHQK